MKPIPLPDTLAALIRKHCSPEWQELLRQQCTTVSMGAGALIFQEHQPADDLYIVWKGKVKVHSAFAPGSSRILRFARDGQVVGHRGMGGDFTYTVTGTALVPTTVDRIPMQAFLSAARANPDFSYHFMLFFAEELRRSEEQTKAMLHLSALQRVAKAILATLRCFGYDRHDRSLLAYTPSRQDLADYAGTTYESTIRALSALQKRQLVKSVGRELRILDAKGLAQLVQG
jgi:CRP/FNR family transcriptional regulator